MNRRSWVESTETAVNDVVGGGENGYHFGGRNGASSAVNDHRQIVETGESASEGRRDACNSRINRMLVQHAPSPCTPELVWNTAMVHRHAQMVQARRILSSGLANLN